MPARSWQRAWKKAPWMRLLPGLTLPQSTLDASVGRFLSSFVAVGPVNRVVTPGSASGEPTSDGSGLTSVEFSTSRKRIFSLERTSPVSSPSMKAKVSKKSSMAWPKSGSMRSGRAFAHPTSARLTSASASSFSRGVSTWPTPDAALFNASEDPASFETRRRRLKERGINGNGAGTPLAVKAAQWSTPRAADGDKMSGPSSTREGSGTIREAAAIWTTPKTSDIHGAREYDGKRGVGLNSEASVWPTPSVTMHRGNAGVYPTTDTHHSGTTLATAAEMMWATPGANDHKGSSREGQRRGQLDEQAENLWPTPRASEQENRGTRSYGRTGGRALSEEACETVTNWPTPNAQAGTGYMSSGSNRDTWRPTARGRGAGLRPELHRGRPALTTPTDGESTSPSTPTSRPPSRRRLNPRFVEALMGWSQRWALPELISCVFSEMASCPPKRLEHFSNSGDAPSEEDDMSYVRSVHENKPIPYYPVKLVLRDAATLRLVPPNFPLRAIISGGQNGADQAGLRAARVLGLATGGFMPKGFRTLDGFVPELAAEFGVVEMAEKGYPTRTLANVRAADATVRFARDFTSMGEVCTLHAIEEVGKPYLDVDMVAAKDHEDAMLDLVGFLLEHRVAILNVAGNSDRTASGIGVEVERFLVDALSGWRD